MTRRSWVIRAVPAAAITRAPGDRREEQRHGQRQAQVRAQETDVHSVRVLDDENQHHDEDGDADDQPGAHAADPGVPIGPSASAR